MIGDHAFDALRTLEFSEEEVRSVLAHHARPRRSRAFVPVLALLAALLVAVAVPQSRAEMTDALRAVLNGGTLPGQPLPSSDYPQWLREVQFAEGGRPRVIAEAEGQQMLVFRQASGTLCFDFGGVGICDWTAEHLFADGPVALFGPTIPRESGRFTLWGLTLASVKEVEVRFADSPPVRMPAEGAFGIPLDPGSTPQTLLAFDEEGRLLATIDLVERWEHRPAL